MAEFQISTDLVWSFVPIQPAYSLEEAISTDLK